MTHNKSTELNLVEDDMDLHLQFIKYFKTQLNSPRRHPLSIVDFQSASFSRRVFTSAQQSFSGATNMIDCWKFKSLSPFIENAGHNHGKGAKSSSKGQFSI